MCKRKTKPQVRVPFFFFIFFDVPHDLSGIEVGSCSIPLGGQRKTGGDENERGSVEDGGEFDTHLKDSKSKMRSQKWVCVTFPLTGLSFFSSFSSLLCIMLFSAKILVAGEPNVSYICSRYYRAPELIFGATNYTTNIGNTSIGPFMLPFLAWTTRRASALQH